MATVIGLTVALVGVAQVPPDPTAKAAAGHHHSNANLRTKQAIVLRNAMRKLWEDHVTWTRMFIVSAIAELPDIDATATRLLSNQDHIGDAIKPYYGHAAGEQLSSLLREHILIAADVLTAAKNADTPGVEDTIEQWRVNGREIADFLNRANPANWPKSEMRAMMKHHLDRTLNEAVARLNADWDADIAAYDGIHRQALHMADMLSFGIIKQFPGRF
ncbi:MAG: acetylglutamate kinase [Actinomycetota bacterium]